MAVSQNERCQTPNRNDGVCTNLRECQNLLTILTSPNRTPNDLEYLRQSQCGFDKKDPLVCCPVRNNNVVINNNNNNPTTEGGVENNRGPSQGVNEKLPTDCGRDLSNRIVGGNVTELDEFPWMALLEYRKRKFFFPR